MPLPYTKTGRLADVLALLQVLALDEHAHRSEDGLRGELGGAPRSARTWQQVAAEHPEFLRADAGADNAFSLVARHVLGVRGSQRPALPAETLGQLLQLALDLHDRQVARAQRWHVWMPLIVAATAGAFTWLGSALG